MTEIEDKAPPNPFIFKFFFSRKQLIKTKAFYGIINIKSQWAEQGWCSGESSRLLPLSVVRFSPVTICGLSLLLVLTLMQGFFSEITIFLPLKNQFDQKRGPSWKPAKIVELLPL